MSARYCLYYIMDLASKCIIFFHVAHKFDVCAVNVHSVCMKSLYVGELQQRDGAKSCQGMFELAPGLWPQHYLYYRQVFCEVLSYT